MRATRDAQVVRLSRAGFDRVLQLHPQAMMEVARTISRRAREGLRVQPVAVREYAALAFDEVPEIAECGYRYAKAEGERWLREKDADAVATVS